MTRDWKKFETDELFSVWRGYQQTEFMNHDPLRMSIADKVKNFRLTPMEIIRLVDELFERLEVKEDKIKNNES